MKTLVLVLALALPSAALAQGALDTDALEGKGNDVEAGKAAKKSGAASPLTPASPLSALKLEAPLFAKLQKLGVLTFADLDGASEQKLKQTLTQAEITLVRRRAGEARAEQQPAVEGNGKKTYIDIPVRR